MFVKYLELKKASEDSSDDVTRNKVDEKEYLIDGDISGTYCGYFGADHDSGNGHNNESAGGSAHGKEEDDDDDREEHDRKEEEKEKTEDEDDDDNDDEAEKRVSNESTSAC